MEIQSFCHSDGDSADDFRGIMCNSLIVESLVVETAILLHKSLLVLLLQVASQPDDGSEFPNSLLLLGIESDLAVHMRFHCRFPMSELDKVSDPDAENKDAGEERDDDDDEDDDYESDDNEEDDGDESEEESDDDHEDSDDDVEANGDEGSDDDDDDDTDDDDDENDDSDEDDDEEDEEEDQSKLPSRRK